MTILRGFTITILSGLAFAAFGALTGYLIGTFAPDYYQAVFEIPNDSRIDMRQTGLALGLTQGLATGLLVGLVIVLAVAWYNSRNSRPEIPSDR